MDSLLHNVPTIGLLLQKVKKSKKLLRRVIMRSIQTMVGHLQKVDFHPLTAGHHLQIQMVVEVMIGLHLQKV